MATINVLPLQLVNKIAAGECIERPASVVKELVENALDAGATKIDISVEQGGAKLIRVVDNGSGIPSDDLPTAVMPHATSKLHDENDLYAISTMGFRGEALSSVAAVSVVKMFSVCPDADAGSAIEVIDGRCSPVRPYAGSAGTVVETHNLFYNTPARRKFLKTPGTEFGHIQEQVIRTALTHPQIAFTLQHNGRSVLDVPTAETTRARISAIFGPELSEPLLQVFVQDDVSTFQAYISRPEDSKPSQRWQYIFVNRRPVRDRYISHALREAYRGMISADRQPIAFLYLDMDPTIVDVNVHPTKSEVRFSNSGEIHSLVLGAIRDRFLSADLPATLMPSETRDDERPTTTTPPQTDQTKQEAIKQSVAGALADFMRSPAAAQQRLTFDASRTTAKPSTPPATRSTSPATVPQHREPPEHIDVPAPALQIHNTYLVAETDDGFMIVDQHALHERALYQKLKDNLATGAMPRQRLLVPQVVTLTGRQMSQIDSARQTLRAVGVEIEPFGPRSIAVHSLPALVDLVDAGEFVEDLLARLEARDDLRSDDVVEDILESLACKAAVKAGDPLTPDEIQALLKYRQEIDFASTCPHGRPTALQMTLDDLRKKFKRT